MVQHRGNEVGLGHKDLLPGDAERDYLNTRVPGRRQWKEPRRVLMGII